MEESIEITLPKLGESILSATIVQWFKKPGDRIERDEPLLEVSTDKVNSEIPSPVEGILQEILAHPDQELEVGAPLALLLTKDMSEVASSSEVSSTKTIENTNINEGNWAPAKTDIATGNATSVGLSPAVLRLLQEKKIPLEEVDKIPHTGQGGRLTKQDVEGYCPLKNKPTVCQSDSERVKMSGLRKAIADNMVKSFYEAPHASLITEVDVTGLMKWIGEQKHQFLQDNGVKLTITPYVARALCRAVRVYPLINSSLEKDTIVMKKSVNLGIAVSIDQGVMVPVIRNCQSLALPEIAKGIAQLADKARSERLLPHEVQEGSITLTNFGMTGTMIGIPIIRYPEVAIIGLGAIVKKVAAMPDDSIAIRSMMMVSLTFDHRVLDGLYGCGFLNELKNLLEHTKVDTE